MTFTTDVNTLKDLVKRQFTFSDNHDGRQPDIPRHRWIKDAMEKFVDLGYAEKVENRRDNYKVKYKKIESPLDKFCPELLQGRESKTKNDEQSTLEKYNYPDLTAHKKAHKDLIDKVMNFKQDLENGKATLTMDLMDFLTDWLKNHILDTDKKYSSFLMEKMQKVSRPSPVVSDIKPTTTAIAGRLLLPCRACLTLIFNRFCTSCVSKCVPDTSSRKQSSKSSIVRPIGAT